VNFHGAQQIQRIRFALEAQANGISKVPVTSNRGMAGKEHSFNDARGRDSESELADAPESGVSAAAVHTLARGSLAHFVKGCP
jgi:hypothetical protein